MKKSKTLYHGHRFTGARVRCAVRLYFRFRLSLRDVEALLFKRGAVVSYETVRCWRDWRTGQSRTAQARYNLAPRRDVYQAAR
jgi:putative transposase